MTDGGHYEKIYPDYRPASNLPNQVDDKRIMDPGISQEAPPICHLRKTPLMLYGIFTELTRQFYSSDNNIPIDVCATWDADDSQTGVWIGPEYDFEDNLEIRPAIYIKLSRITYTSLTGRNDGLAAMDLEEGEYHYSRNGSGTATWVHIGSSKGEAVALSAGTFDYLDAFSRVIRDDFNFQIFKPEAYEPLTHIEESDDRIVSSITFSFSFEDTWILRLESQKLKELVFRARQVSA